MCIFYFRKLQTNYNNSKLKRKYFILNMLAKRRLGGREDRRTGGQGKFFDYFSTTKQNSS